VVLELVLNREDWGTVVAMVAVVVVADDCQLGEFPRRRGSLHNSSYPIVDSLLRNWICAPLWMVLPLRRRILSLVVWIA